MASFKQYTASGGSTEAFSIPSFTSDEIKVRVDGVLKTAGTGTTAGSSHDYEIQSYTVNGGTIAWVSGKVPSSGTVYIYRDTKLLNNASSDVEGKATYSGGTVIYHGDLNNNQKQVLRALEEQDDQLIQSWNLASGVVETDSIKDGTIVDADINASANISGSKLQVSSGSNAGSMSAANFTKLAGIEANATADQSNAEIRTAVEAATDSNVFTDADHTKLNGIEANATTDQTNDEIKTAVGAASDSNIFTDALKTKLDGIAASANNYSISSDLLDEDDLATDSATKVPSQQSVKAYISTTSQPKDAELSTLAGMQSGTATNLASGTALTSTTAELNLLDGKSVVTTVSGSSTDVQLPTAKAVNDQIANLLNEVGGFVPIADDQSFPNVNPDPGDDAGTIVSIADAGGLVVNSSGVTTTGRTLGGATVTINGIDTALRGTTIAAGKGMLVQTTTTLNTYDYHRLIVDEAGVASAQTLVSDFNDRYQVASSAPSTHPDGSALTDGDLWFDTSANTMKVYDLGNTSYAAVTSVGDYKLLTIVNDGQTSGSPTYNGSNVSFDLRDDTNAASITSVGQLLISVNGVLQKPNAGSWSASNEGFHLEGTNGIKFCTAPASGDSIFVTLIGSATAVNVPATNSIVEAAIQDNQVSEVKLKISNAGSNGYFLQKQSGDTGGLTWAAAGGAGSIADDSIVEAKLDIHADPSGTDKFLGYTSNGMEWVVPTDTNTQLSEEQVEDFVGGMLTGNTETGITVTYEDSDGTIDFVVAPEGDTVKSTGETGTTKFLRVDGDDSCSWQVPPDTVYTHPNHSGEVTSTADGAQVIASNVIDEDNLKVDNSPTNDYILTAKSSAAGGLTWAALSAAPEVTGTASGAIAANKAVMVKSDGNFEQVTGTNEGAGSLSSSFDSWATGDRPRIVYNATNSRFLAVYSDSGNSDYPTSIVGTVSGTSISWGTPTVITSTGGSQCTITWNPTDQKALAIWKNGTSSTKFWIGTMAGGNTSLTWGSEQNETGMNNCKHLEQVWNPDANRHAVVYRDGGDGNNFKIKEYTTTSGSVVENNGFEIKNQDHTDVNICYDTTRNRYLCVGGNIGAGTAEGKLYTLKSGSGESPDEPSRTGAGEAGTIYHATSSYDNQIVYDANANRSVVFWRGGSNSDNLLARVIELDSSDNVTLGTTQTLLSSNTVNQAWSVAYDSNSKKIILNYASSNEGTVWKMSDITINTSDNSMTVSTPFTIQSSFSGSESHAAAGGDKVVSISNKISDGTGNSYGVVLTPSSTNLDADRYIGFAADTYSNGNTATVKVASNTSTQSSMTAATKQYVQSDGSVGGTAITPSVEAGTALSSTKLLIKG